MRVSAAQTGLLTQGLRGTQGSSSAAVQWSIAHAVAVGARAEHEDEQHEGALRDEHERMRLLVVVDRVNNNSGLNNEHNVRSRGGCQYVYCVMLRQCVMGVRVLSPWVNA